MILHDYGAHRSEAIDHTREIDRDQEGPDDGEKTGKAPNLDGRREGRSRSNRGYIGGDA